MGVIRRVGARERPERVASRAAEYQARLERALALAARRAARSSTTVRALFASAVVEDVALKDGIKSTKILFTAPPFKEGLHQIWGWHQLAALTDSEVASWITRALRESIARAPRVWEAPSHLPSNNEMNADEARAR